MNELARARAARPTLSECDVVLLTDESALLATSLSVPTVMLFHIVWHGWLDRHGLAGIATKPQALVYAAMERRICRAADRVVAVAPHVRREIERAGCAGDRIVDIPNGVDTERFHPDAAPAAEEFTVHFQGRLAPQKNPQLLVEAAARSEQPWQVTVGGAGPLADDLREAVDVVSRPPMRASRRVSPVPRRPESPPRCR